MNSENIAPKKKENTRICNTPEKGKNQPERENSLMSPAPSVPMEKNKNKTNTGKMTPGRWVRRDPAPSR
jgi:hypothetical protein